MTRKKYNVDPKKCNKLTQSIIKRFKLCAAETGNGTVLDRIPFQKWVEILESEKQNYPTKSMEIVWTILDDITQSSGEHGYVYLSDVEALCYDICNDSVSDIHGYLLKK